MNQNLTIWQKFKQSKLALVSFIYILLSALIAIFAYAISPDNSTNADLQTVEIQSKLPGYRQLFLKLDSEEQKTKISTFFNGYKKEQIIPITDFKAIKDSVLIHRYIDEDTALLQTIAFQNFEPKKHIEEKTFLFGTDKLGRDILSRLLIATRVSFAVGIIAVIISLLFGMVLGGLAGYYRKRTDAVISWLINVVWSIPTLLLVFALTIVLGKGFWQIFIAVGLTMWVGVARLVRGQVLSIREQDFVQAARAIGATDSRILIKHILPNIRGPLLVMAAANFATAILLEAGLSFLGIGVQPPQPSWGLMMRENYTYLLTGQPILAIIPGIAIMLLVLAFYLVGNGLRDATDARLSLV